MQQNCKAIVLIAAFTYGVLAPLQVLADPIKLEEGAPVRLKLLDSISSGTNHEGDSVSFRVIDDVMAADGKTILIKSGAPAWGMVSKLEGRGCLGEKGQLSLAVEGAKSIDGKKIPLRAAVNREGKGQLGPVIALSVVICPLFLLMRGKDATIPAGTQISAYVDRDSLVEVTPAPGISPAVAAAGTVNIATSEQPLPTKSVADSDAPVSLVNTADDMPEASEALEKLYNSGLLSKKEYETKKKTLTKKSIALKK